MSDEYLAVAIQAYKLNTTNPHFGVVLTATQTTGQDAKLLIANASGNQTISSGNLLFSGSSKIGIGVVSPNARFEVTDTASQILFGNATDQGALHGDTNGARLLYGARNDGTNYIARKANFSGVFADGSTIKFMGNTGLTIDSNFTPGEYARFVGGRFLIGTTTDNGTDVLQVNGTISAATPTGLGTAAASGKVVPVGANGMLPAEILPSAGVQQANFIYYSPNMKLGVGDGVTDTFELKINSGTPLVLVGNVPQLPNVYSVTNGKITFNAGSIPANGAVVSAIMFEPYTMTVLTQIGTGDGSTVQFTLPGAGTNEIVWVGGAFQEPGAGNAYTVSAGKITFATAPTTGVAIMAIAAVVGAVNPCSEPTLLGTGDGATVQYTLPGVGEILWVGGAMQRLYDNYTLDRVTNSVTFSAAPPNGTKIWVSTATNPPSEVDALTLGGYPADIAPNANTIVQRRNDGTIQGAQPTGLGTAAAAGLAMMLDNNGLAPSSVMPIAGALLGAVKNGGNVSIAADGTMSVTTGNIKAYFTTTGTISLTGLKTTDTVVAFGKVQNNDFQYGNNMTSLNGYIEINGVSGPQDTMYVYNGAYVCVAPMYAATNLPASCDVTIVSGGSNTTSITTPFLIVLVVS